MMVGPACGLPATTMLEREDMKGTRGKSNCVCSVLLCTWDRNIFREIIFSVFSRVCYAGLAMAQETWAVIRWRASQRLTV